ncbi:MAG: ABC transporter ATP-binding protein [Spirochaetaceae bacterium]|jgi:simple sugar transport system ATP-binding protein|nr:ABC transporter ATP-binding protein [Spirochaetaceae bacterium]
MGEKYAVEMTGITKRFPGIIANDGVNLVVRDNEVLALLGENGAGKSTLMSILFGVYNADEGVIKIHGKEAHITNPNDAYALGVGMVHQHFKLVHNYTVTENIVLGLEPVSKHGLLDLASAEKRVAELSKRYGLDVSPNDKIEDITVGMQQRVEILKVLYRDAKIIIFDEPTAVLTPQEIDELMEIIRSLKAEGKTIILITHKLREIKAVADRCTVLRRGKYIGTVSVPEVSENKLVEMMVGRVVNLNIEKKAIQAGETVLSVKNITVKNSRGLVAVENLSLDVRSGEILGLAGVDGNGQSELLDAITGMKNVEAGKIILCGEDITALSIRKRIERGLLNVPEDRQKHGIVGAFTIGENSVLKNYYKPAYISKCILLNYAEMNRTGNSFIEEFDIRAGQKSLTLAGSMSGGNQQKLIIAREINLGPKLLIVAQPTRGLDVGAIEYIRKRIVAERDEGRAVLLVSFELDEVMSLCDRVAAISKGSIAGIKKAGEVDEREIGAMMAGKKSA